jgi:sulfate adenylyltransferase
VPTPQHCPTPRELADLELLTGGALAPTTRFNESGSPVTLDLPPGLVGQEVELVDPEGLPLARLSADGEVEALTHAQHGPFRRLHVPPRQVRETHAGATFVPVVDALTEEEVERLRGLGTPVVLLALTGPGTPELSAVALLRATLATARRLPAASVVAVPLASHGDPVVDHDLGVQVVSAYAGPDPVLALGDSDGEYAEDVAAIVEADRPGPAEQGLVLFLTGLSGSGKSTVAQAVIDALLERGERTVTSLDGDVVRRNLSAGLTFSREDRETNIRRIGWVAAEISRHGGVAVCSPIAPFDGTRQDVRAMTAAAGGAFFLVHVATPLEECERRDRKGLYAKARRGEIPDFTGISSPYEAPEDADLRLDTTERSIEDCRDEVLAALAAAGFVSGAEPDEVEEEPIRVLFVCTANICRSPGAPAPRPGRAGGGQQRGHAGLRRRTGQRHDGGGVRTLEHRGGRLPQPPGDRRDDRRRRRGADRGGGAPHPAPGGAAGGVPQDLHARPVRRQRAGGRPGAAREGTPGGAREPTGAGSRRARHRRPLPAWPRGGAALGRHHGAAARGARGQAAGGPARLIGESRLHR